MVEWFICFTAKEMKTYITLSIIWSVAYLCVFFTMEYSYSLSVIRHVLLIYLHLLIFGTIFLNCKKENRKYITGIFLFYVLCYTNYLINWGWGVQTWEFDSELLEQFNKGFPS